MLKMPILDIYSKYNILPNLQLHQLRVASVAKIIADNFKGDIDGDSIVRACLLHDMGNIIKFDLNYFPEFLEPQGLEYWQNIKNSFVEKYGSNEHEATLAIAKEISVSEKVLDCIKHVGFSILKINERENSFENKICNYADMRVGPFGILSLEERLIDGRKRYESREHPISADKDTYSGFSSALESMEKQIQEKMSIDLESIRDESIIEILENLKSFEI